jgi:chemotaxis protein MotB
VQKQIRTMADNHVDLAEVASKVRVVATPEGVLIEVDDSDDGMLFETSSSALKPALRDFLVKLVPVLASHEAPIEIQGHTDAAPFPTGADKTNWELSFERASAARKILERAGLDRDRVVGVIGRGAAVPLLPDAPLSARNRRLSILLRTAPVASGAAPTTPPTEATPPTEEATPPLTEAAKDGDALHTSSVRAMIRGTASQARRLLEP